jgi:hypothetical protein
MCVLRIACSHWYFAMGAFVKFIAVSGVRSIEVYAVHIMLQRSVENFATSQSFEVDRSTRI